MKRSYYIAAVLLFLFSATGQAGVMDLRGLVSGEPGLIHHYTFEGANNTARLADSASGGAALTVVSYGSGSPVVGVANGIRLDQPGWDGTGTTLTPYNDGGGLGSGGAGTGTVADIALPAAMTVEAIIRPLASLSGGGYAVSTRAGANQRGYYLRQLDLSNSITTAVGDTDTSRTILQYFRPGEWYYVVNTYEQSGANTLITSYVANLTQGDWGLTKVLDSVVATGTYGTAAPLGVGLADFTKAGYSYQRAFNGQIDEVAMYNAVLDQAAAQRHLTALTRTAEVRPALVGRWTFDTDFSDSVGTRHGTAIGAVINPDGKAGGAAFFDGSDDRVIIPKEVIPAKEFTISFWDFSPGVSGTNDGYMVGAGNDAAGLNDIFLRRYSTPGPGASGYAGDIASGSGTLGNFGPFPRGQWHHHVVTHDASGVGRWYIDGALQRTQPSSTFNGLRGNLFLGNRADLNRDYLGSLDDLQIYDRPLTSTQAAGLALMPGYALDALILTPVPLANASFELPVIPAGSNGLITGAPILGWIESGAASPGADGPNSALLLPAEHSGGVNPRPTSGVQVANLILRNSPLVTDTWIFQSLGIVEPGDVGRTLILEADVASRADIAGGASAAAAFATGVTTAGLGTNVGAMLATATDTSVLPAEGFHGLMETITIGPSLVGQELWIRLSLNRPSPISVSEQYFFDNVRLTQLERVPEPCTLVLLGLGAAVLGLVGWRRRRG